MLSSRRVTPEQRYRGAYREASSKVICNRHRSIQCIRTSSIINSYGPRKEIPMRFAYGAIMSELNRVLARSEPFAFRSPCPSSLSTCHPSRDVSLGSPTPPATSARAPLIGLEPTGYIPHPPLLLHVSHAHPATQSSKQTRPPTSNSLHLALGQWRPPKPRRQLIPIKEQSLLGLDRPQARAGLGPDPPAVLRRAAVAAAAAGLEVRGQGTVLLGFLAVGGEGGREGAGGGGGVDLGGVVDFCWGG